MKLRHSKKIFHQVSKLYRRKAKILDPHAKEKIETHLTSLQTALIKKNKELSHRIASHLHEASRHLMPRTLWDKTRDFFTGTLFALAVAVLIRTMWFELYTIPTGSMRPTLKEGDFLVVSKTDFGLNVPLKPAHFYFDPSLVSRGSIFVFNGAGMDISDVDTKYFYLFPGKKQFVKRLIGKPGDTLYFYGGKIYGMDASGHELTELRDSPWMQSLEHIPFIRFDGKVETPSSQIPGLFDEVHFYQMNQPIAKLKMNGPFRHITGEMVPQKGQAPLLHYSELWGMENYAMARLLTASQAEKLNPGSTRDLEPAPLYLELTHHPSLKEAHLIHDEVGRFRPDLGVSVSLLPLTQEHLARLAQHLTTCRFKVTNGTAYRLGFDPKDPYYSRHFPKLPHVPDGTYEIQNGKAYTVHWTGHTSELPPDHPLYPKTPEQIQFLYNLGIEFLNHYTPAKNSPAPSRYAYFQGGDLYLLAAPILEKQDPALIRFLQREYQKQSLSTTVHPYLPFEDNGPPLAQDGTLDTEFLRKYGLTIPPKSYLALGDNHAMSADSRAFGFVPEDNLKGGVSFLFFPRIGAPNQAPSAHLTFPNLFVFTTAALIIITYSLRMRRKLDTPLKFD